MKLIIYKHNTIIALTFLSLLLSAWKSEAQPTRNSTTFARQLDSLLQDYAYRGFVHPRTGIPYKGVVPSNLTGINISVIRLRSGSLRKRGVKSYKEFDIPTGITAQPYVKRLAIVYQNLGNWSSYYYPLPGFTYLAPVLGLLAYSAANLSATNLPELDVVVSSTPISIKFTDSRLAPSRFTAKCVRFDLNGSLEFTDLVTSNVCSVFHQGHFSIVVNSTEIPPVPAPVPMPSSGSGEGHKSKAWKIVVSVIGGILLLLFLFFIIVWVVSYKHKKKMVEMQKREDEGEVLQMERVGNTRLPVASMMRTPPVIESNYVP